MYTKYGGEVPCIMSNRPFASQSPTWHRRRWRRHSNSVEASASVAAAACSPSALLESPCAAKSQKTGPKMKLARALKIQQ
jgi:hypothetical protein